MVISRITLCPKDVHAVYPRQSEYRRVMASGLADGPIDAAAVATLHSTATAAAMTRFDVDAVAVSDVV